MRAQHISSRLGWLGLVCGLGVVLTACSAAAPPGAQSSTRSATESVAVVPPAEQPTLTPLPAIDPASPPAPAPAVQTVTATASPISPPAASTAVPIPTPTPILSAGGQAVLAEYGTSGRREIALTFDAGADRGYAEEILDLLQAEGITASFGILGQWAEANPDLIQRMVDEGHLLFNHSWTHRSLTGATTGEATQTYDEVLAELSKTERAVAEITGGYELKPYFRPPYGDYDAASLDYLARAGYPVALMWSCDSRDSLGATAAEILATCIDTAQPGRIVLLHVGAQSAASEALPTMIASLRDQGFTFVTSEQILQP